MSVRTIQLRFIKQKKTTRSYILKKKNLIIKYDSLEYYVHYLRYFAAK